MTGQRKSYVLCGHHKCATRWLVSVLQTNGEINVIAQRGVGNFIKENKDRIRETIRQSSKPVLIDYIYSICDEDALAVLKELDPDMGAIIVYREPVDIILSMHNYQRSRYDARMLVGYARDVVVDGPLGDKDFVKSVKSGVLHEQFERLFRFDRNARNLRKYFDTYLELKYEDMSKDETAYVSGICDYLGVSREFKLPPSRINPSIAVKSNLLGKITAKSFLMMTGLNSAALYDAFRHGNLKPSLFKSLLKLNHKDPHFLSAAQREELREYFSNMVTAFAQTTSLDIDDWGYATSRASSDKPRVSA